MPIVYKGVEIDSGAPEGVAIDSMKQVLDKLPSEVTHYIRSIFCGSEESGHCVVVKPVELSDEHKYLLNAAFNRGCAKEGIFSLQNWVPLGMPA